MDEDAAFARREALLLVGLLFQAEHVPREVPERALRVQLDRPDAVRARGMRERAAVKGGVGRVGPRQRAGEATRRRSMGAPPGRSRPRAPPRSGIPAFHPRHERVAAGRLCPRHRARRMARRASRLPAGMRKPPCAGGQAGAGRGSRRARLRRARCRMAIRAAAAASASRTGCAAAPRATRRLPAPPGARRRRRRSGRLSHPPCARRHRRREAKTSAPRSSAGSSPPDRRQTT